MELSKEHFESYLGKQFNKFEFILDEKLAKQTQELQDYVHQSFETQQVYIDARFDELIEDLQIVKRLDKHQVWIDKIAGKVGMTLEHTN